MITLIIRRFLNSNLLKNIFSLSILQVLSAFLSLVSIPLLARILEPTIFGVVMFLHLIVNYFIWFTEWGFSQGGTQKIAANRLDYTLLTKFFNQIYTSQLFLIFLAIIPLVMALIFFQTKYKFENNVIIMIVLYFILSSAIPIWFLNGMERVTYALLMQIYPKILSLLCVIFLIKSPDDFTYYFIALNLGLAFAFFQTFYIIKKDYKIIFIFTNPIVQLSNNFNYFISSFAKTMSSNIIPFFLGILTSIEVFGFYSLADRIKGATLIILNPVYHSVFPRMCNLVNQKNYFSNLKKYSILIIFLILTISLFVFLLINPIILHYIGANYQLSSTLVKLMIPSIILNSVISIMLYFVLIPFNLNKELMKISILNFIFILIISYPIISFLESYGAVLILTISDLLFMLMYLYVIFQNKILKN